MARPPASGRAAWVSTWYTNLAAFGKHRLTALEADQKGTVRPMDVRQEAERRRVPGLSSLALSTAGPSGSVCALGNVPGRLRRSNERLITKGSEAYHP